MSAPIPTSSPATPGVLEKVTIYHWLVVIIASCGWLFDCMDQRLFTLARESALKDLLAGDPTKLGNVKEFIGLATMAMMVGWATGGIIFGIMSDKWGRVKTMVVTLLIYSGFTGLCGIAQGWLDFMLYRFLVGQGVGGMSRYVSGDRPVAYTTGSIPRPFRAKPKARPAPVFSLKASCVLLLVFQ